MGAFSWPTFVTCMLLTSHCCSCSSLKGLTLCFYLGSSSPGSVSCGPRALPLALRPLGQRPVATTAPAAMETAIIKMAMEMATKLTLMTTAAKTPGGRKLETQVHFVTCLASSSSSWKLVLTWRCQWIGVVCHLISCHSSMVNDIMHHMYAARLVHRRMLQQVEL